MADTTPGIYNKFDVVRRNGEKLSDKTLTFTLVPGRDVAARKALKAYADEVFETIPELALDIYKRLSKQDFSPAPESV